MLSEWRFVFRFFNVGFHGFVDSGEALVSVSIFFHNLLLAAGVALLNAAYESVSRGRCNNFISLLLCICIEIVVSRDGIVQ